MLSNNTDERDFDKKERNLILCQKRKLKKYQEILKSDRAGSFRIIPSPVPREYCTGSEAIWLGDFSSWPSEITRVITNNFVLEYSLSMIAILNLSTALLKKQSNSLYQEKMRGLVSQNY